jgi:hypothetical protein
MDPFAAQRARTGSPNDLVIMAATRKGVGAQSDHFRDNIDSETRIMETRLLGEQYVFDARSATDHGAPVPTPTREDGLRESDQNRNVIRYEEFLSAGIRGLPSRLQHP